MDIDEAKQVKLIDIMSMLGHDVKAIERGGTEHKYLSPFRLEKEPSFNVNLIKNAWFDFGLSKGGNAIDFAVEYAGFIGQGSTVSDALSWLNKIMGRGEAKPSSTRIAKISEKESRLELVSISEIKSKAIFKYLSEERKIDATLIPIYLKQIRYKNLNSDKVYFAYGIKNLSGGYEIRVASDKYPFKSAINGRDVSLVTGMSGVCDVVNIFEGTTDFLSLLTMMGLDTLAGDALIMHSLSSYKRTIEVIAHRGYKSINLFLDNNEAGKTHSAAFLRDLGADKVKVQSNLFLPHTDINEALKADNIPQMLRSN